MILIRRASVATDVKPTLPYVFYLCFVAHHRPYHPYHHVRTSKARYALAQLDDVSPSSLVVCELLPWTRATPVDDDNTVACREPMHQPLRSSNQTRASWHDPVTLLIHKFTIVRASRHTCAHARSRRTVTCCYCLVDRPPCRAPPELGLS